MTPLDIDKVKRHLRISHSIEDEIINDYIEFAKSDVIEAVFDSESEELDTDKLDVNPTFQRAVINLSAYYYSHRLTIHEANMSESPFSVTHAIQTLRATKERFYHEKP